jgi:uncharacterized tellurite resistance protein B-like protein
MNQTEVNSLLESDTRKRALYANDDCHGDLSAMRPQLTPEQRRKYIQELWNIVGSPEYRDDIQMSDWPMINATAAEHSEAFQRAIGKREVA